MYILNLNHMFSNAERCSPVARAETKEQLLAFVEREKVEPYTEERWCKTFRKGGPLEWFNPPSGSGVFFQEFVDIGTEDDWATRAREQYKNLLGSVLLVG